MHLRRSLLSLSFLAVAACNSSSTVGSNDAEDGTGGAGGDGSVVAGTSSGGSPSTGTPAATSGVTSSSGGEGGNGGASTTSVGSQVASVTTGDAVTSASSGGGIENAYVLVRAVAYDGWLGGNTSVSIEANLEPFDPVLPAPAACASSTQSPTMYVAPDNIDLEGSPITASAPGYGMVDAFWVESSNSFSASFPDLLPDGTVIDLAFGASSAIFPGETLSVTVRSAQIDVPLMQIGGLTSIDYQEGTDLVVDWVSAPLASSLGAFVVMTTPPNPPPEMVVVWCAGTDSISEHILGVSLMDDLLADNQAKIDAGWGGQIWASLMLLDEQGHEVATSGNFVTTVSQVGFSRPVAVTP